jgi:hypothetical protein
MTNLSDESEGAPPKKIEYRRLPREVEAVVGEERAKIEKTANINFDGRQYMIRFPKEISDAVGLTKDHKIKFTVVKPKPMSGEEPELTIAVIRDAAAI